MGAILIYNSTQDFPTGININHNDIYYARDIAIYYKWNSLSNAYRMYELTNEDYKQLQVIESQSTSAGGMNIKDSGEREIMSTGSQRDTQIGKPRPELIPASTLTKLAIHYGNGSKKYDAWNWSKGQSISRYMASFGRHKDKWSMGLTDEPHLIAMIWNLISIDYTLDAIKCGMLPSELDDRHESQKENNPMGKLIEEIIEQNIKTQKDKSK